MLLDNPPEQNASNLTVDDGAIGNVKVPIYTPDQYSTFIGNLEGRGLIIPDFIVKIHKLFNWYVKRSSEYFIGATQIPPGYFMPGLPYYITSGLDTVVNTAYTNIGQAKLHMDKYGVKYSKFSESMLDPVEKNLQDVDVIAYLNHRPLKIYDGANPQYLYGEGDFHVDGSEAHRYYFRDNPNESKIHAYAKLLQPYEATYNKYGGAFCGTGATTVPTTQNYINMFYCDKQEGTGWKGNSIAGFSDIALLFNGVWKQTNTLNVSWTGTYLSADIDTSTWPLAMWENLKYGTGLDETKTDNILINAIISDMF
jgi:hypothetical protein